MKQEIQQEENDFKTAKIGNNIGKTVKEKNENEFDFKEDIANNNINVNVNENVGFNKNNYKTVKLNSYGSNKSTYGSSSNGILNIV